LLVQSTRRVVIASVETTLKAVAAVPQYLHVLPQSL